MRLIPTTLAALLVAAGTAHADCTTPATDTERAACVGQELRASDALINAEYASLHDALDPTGQAALRHEENAWIKTRANTCKVDRKESDREKWFSLLLTDYSKTVCVVRFTDQRVAALKAEQAARTPATPVSSAMAPPPTAAPEVYTVVAQNTPATGKWYFEATLKVSQIAAGGSATMFVGAAGLGFGNVGTLQTIRRRNSAENLRVIGIAEDLDGGKLYIRLNGAWLTVPGSAAGAELKLGRPYQSALSSSVPLSDFLDHGQVDLNFGAHAFAYAMPDGYLPLDARPPRRVVE